MGNVTVCRFIGGPMNGEETLVDSSKGIDISGKAARRDQVTYDMAYVVRSPFGINTRFFIPLSKNPIRRFLDKQRAKAAARTLAHHLNREAEHRAA